jgi:hypothetical protein
MLAETLVLDPDALADGALEAPRCECMTPVVDKWRECVGCGREVRTEGSLSWEFRRAAYMRRLLWAAGMGLPRRTGFRGLSAECGKNPELWASSPCDPSRAGRAIGMAAA